MVAFNFHNRFVPLIEQGKKFQTIRKTKRCNAGDMMRLYTGMRTKRCRLITEATCNDVVKVCIRKDGIRLCPKDESIWMGGATIFADNFSRTLGFSCFLEALDFYKKYHGLPFTGWKHRWDPVLKKEG
jgi:hypothetical protein